MPVKYAHRLKPSLLLRIVAWWTGGHGVWLRDADGEITCSIAYLSPFGEVFAKRWWPFNTHNVELLDDGSVKQTSYVMKWVRWE